VTVCTKTEFNRVAEQPKDPLVPLSFERDIRPLFREKDRSAMLKHFDLWWYPDVVQHQVAICSYLSNGSMPCDLAWEPNQVALIESWVAQGSQR
jgi:hypothetical protein